jgi:hypothetical protein
MTEFRSAASEEDELDIDYEGLCDFCNDHIHKNLSPTNPSCDGEFCDKALEMMKQERNGGR